MSRSTFLPHPPHISLRRVGGNGAQGGIGSGGGGGGAGTTGGTGGRGGAGVIIITCLWSLCL